MVKLMIGVVSGFVAGILVAHLSIPVAWAQLRTMNTTRLITTDLAGWCDGKEVTVELNQAGPGTSGKHYHPGHSFTYILEGSEFYTLEGQPRRTVPRGRLAS